MSRRRSPRAHVWQDAAALPGGQSARFCAPHAKLPAADYLRRRAGTDDRGGDFGPGLGAAGGTPGRRLAKNPRLSCAAFRPCFSRSVRWVGRPGNPRESRPVILIVSRRAAKVPTSELQAAPARTHPAKVAWPVSFLTHPQSRFNPIHQIAWEFRALSRPCRTFVPKVSGKKSGRESRVGHKPLTPPLRVGLRVGNRQLKLLSFARIPSRLRY